VVGRFTHPIRQYLVDQNQSAGVLVHQSIKSPLDSISSPADSFTTSAQYVWLSAVGHFQSLAWWLSMLLCQISCMTL